MEYQTDNIDDDLELEYLTYLEDYESEQWEKEQQYVRQAENAWKRED